MFHITQVTVSNLAGSKQDLSLELSRNVNVLFGTNGSGKTSLLKLIHAALEQSTRSLREAPFSAATIECRNEHEQQTYTRSITKEAVLESEAMELNRLKLPGASVETPTYWQTKPSRKPSSKTTWSHRYLPTSRMYEGMGTGSRRNLFLEQDWTEEDLDKTFANAINRLWIQYWTETLNAVRNIQGEGLVDILKSALVDESGGPEPSPEDIDSIFRRVKRFLARHKSAELVGGLSEFKGRIERDGKLRRIISDINKVEVEIENTFEPRLKLFNQIDHLFSRGKHLDFKNNKLSVETEQKERIDIALLSSGEKQVIRILVETLLAEANPIIIDEPELSLHIDWQKGLISLMRELNPRAQIIVATHSPEIMADITDDCIYEIG